MERIFVPVGSYEGILSQLGKWKVIGVKDLYEIMASKISYQGFSKQIRKLESNGFVASFIFPNKSKYVYLTSKAARLVPQGVEYSNSKEMLTHDLKCGMVLRELIKFKNFVDGEMLEDKTDGFSPDAKIYAKKNEMEYVLALELGKNLRSTVLTKPILMCFMYSKGRKS